MPAPSSNVESYKGPTGPLLRHCSQCLATGPALLKCSGCQVVYYCSREHQIAHRPQHKTICTRIRKARTKLAEETEAVRNATPDFMTPANAFETNIGHFWGILSTRDYMRARYALAAKHLLSVGTLDSIQEALEHMQHMMTLNRSDNLGVRDITPATMLRLDLDQECYDFVKWWETCDPDGTYDWGDTTLPHLNIHDADIYEDPAFLIHQFPNLNFIVAIIILKLKLLVDIRNVKITRKVLAQRGVPTEVQIAIESVVVRSPLSADFAGASTRYLITKEMKLARHVLKLGSTLHHKKNHNFMFLLFEPDEAMSATPEYISNGSWEEAAMAIQYSYPTWLEMGGVMELLKDARACAARDSSDMRKDIIPGSNRTPEELLSDVSVNRMWGYVDDAMTDASWLGPWAERPSEVRYQAFLAASEEETSEEETSEEEL